MASGISPLHGKRLPAAAGSFYPEDADELHSLLSKYFRPTQKWKTKTILKALILPHAGYIYSGQTAAWGYRQLPDGGKHHFVLIGPSHHIGFTGMVSDTQRFWQTPLGVVKHRLPAALVSGVTIESKPHNPEHCLEVQLPFLQYRYGNTFSFTAFLTGFHLEYHKMAQYLMSRFPTSLFLISSDLSHYLPDWEARAKDHATINAIVQFNSQYFSHEDNVACGGQGVIILLEMAKQHQWHAKKLYYDTSATAFGDRSQVVGYAAVGFYG